MNSTKGFTGRRRVRRTKWTVRVIDGIARRLIAIGGIGAIVAVSLVGVFLVVVAAPLFFQPRVLASGNAAIASGAGARHIATDAYQTLAWEIESDGSFAVRGVQGNAAGKVLFEQRANELIGDAKLTASTLSGDGDQVAFGFANGSIRLGRILTATRLLEPEEITDDIRALEKGETAPFEKGIVEQTPGGQLRAQSVSMEVKPPIAVESASPVRAIDFVQRSAGSLVAWVSDDGQLRIGVERTRRNLRTGKTTSEFETTKLDIRRNAAPRDPAFVRVSGRGDQVYLAWSDGQLRRFDVTDLKKPLMAEEVNLLSSADAELTALTWLAGRGTLVTGDSKGRVRGWFRAQTAQADGSERRQLVAAHEFASAGSPVTAISASNRSRTFAAAHGDGSVAVYNMTTEKQLLRLQIDRKPAISALALSPKDDGLIAAANNGLAHWRFDLRSPEVTLASLFLPVWYEGYSEPSHLWQSTSGDDAFEPKFGLWPLVFGTLKATFYSLLFGVPLALLAAVYTSEFLHPKARSRIKPTIELMAGMPSVVLGFLAAIVFAPFIERYTPVVLASFITIPLCFLLGAFLWQLAPHAVRMPLSRWRFLLIVAVLPVGPFVAWLLGPFVERWLFAGDIQRWLAQPALGNGVGGWMMIFMPLAGVTTLALIGLRVDPWLRRLSAQWSRIRCAAADLGKFVAACAFMVLSAWLVSFVLSQVLGIDPRGSLFGVYEQRNSLVVGFVMGFAIIPIIYTLADDALNSVPQQLRSASLGAGATPWQTATRIIIPTAMSGLFSAVMIGLGRAVGETMIVLMATGSTPVLDVNIFNGFRTLSANIAIELPEAVQGSTHYRTLFLAALLLFTMTFTLNTAAEIVRRRVRKRAYQL